MFVCFRITLAIQSFARVLNRSLRFMRRPQLVRRYDLLCRGLRIRCTSRDHLTMVRLCGSNENGYGKHRNQAKRISGCPDARHKEFHVRTLEPLLPPDISAIELTALYADPGQLCADGRDSAQ